MEYIIDLIQVIYFVPGYTHYLFKFVFALRIQTVDYIIVTNRDQ